MSSRRISRSFRWLRLTALTPLAFVPAASDASEDIAFLCSGIHRTNLFDSGTNVTGVSVIIDLDKRIVQTPVGLLPIVVMNDKTIGVQTDIASGSIDRVSGKASFSQYPRGVLINNYDLLCQVSVAE
jgi:hypothetical protein